VHDQCRLRSDAWFDEMSIIETIVRWNAAKLNISAADLKAAFLEISDSLAQRVPACDKIANSTFLDRLDEIYAQELALHK
jgi:hypothetical protein